ncbi:mitochondrial transcription termination factor [Oratosquilla oratoria]|uniref:mitochondrial transcription termination factor n=1 Tax=Oratosquilla oratoria TaxID=337810 RepID=UPI003F7660B4
MLARSKLSNGLKHLLSIKSVFCEYGKEGAREFNICVNSLRRCLVRVPNKTCVCHDKVPSHISNILYPKHSSASAALQNSRTLVQYFSSQAKTLKRSRKRGKNDDMEDVSILDYGSENNEEGQEEEGRFCDTKYHRDFKISMADIGKKVTVGEVVIGELNRLFNISRAEALKMVRSPQFLLVADAAILEVLHFLKEKEIEGTQLKRIQWILLQSVDNLKRKIIKLQHPLMFNTLEEGLGFCYFSEKQLSTYTNQFQMEKSDFPNHKNRVYYLADALSIPVQLVVERILRPNRILIMDLAKMNKILDVLKGHGVLAEDILCDMWIFYHNVELTRERLQLITEAGCDRPRMWMCRCTDNVFQRTCERYKSEKELLGDCKSKVEFLAKRLECSTEFITTYSAGNPGFLRVHVSKLQRQLDLLEAEGFTPEQIRQSPRVLQYSEDRLMSRINAFKEIGYKPTGVAILYKQPRKFEAFYRKLLTMKSRGLEFKNAIEE